MSTDSPMPVDFSPVFKVYQDQMTTLSHGLALWGPNPLKEIYDKVSIGDVGYLHEGSFIRMFNVMLPWGHESNRALGEPEPYESLDCGPFANTFKRQFDRVKHYTRYVSAEGSASNTQAVIPDNVEGVTFKFRNRGALLSLPNGGHHEDIIRAQAFEDYIKDNVGNWFTWAQKNRLGVESVEELILVSGCTLVTSWAAAAFADDAMDAEISLMSTTLNNCGASFVWSNIRGRVLYHNSHFEPFHGEQNSTMTRDQCVFIRGFRVKDDTKQVIRVSCVPEYDDPIFGIVDTIQVMPSIKNERPQSSPYRHPTFSRNDVSSNASCTTFLGDDSLIGGSSSSLDTIRPRINHENPQLLPYPSSTTVQSNGSIYNASFMTSPSYGTFSEAPNYIAEISHEAAFALNTTSNTHDNDLRLPPLVDDAGPVTPTVNAEDRLREIITDRNSPEILPDPPETNQTTTERKEGNFLQEKSSDLFRRMNKTRFASLLGVRNPSRQGKSAMKRTKSQMGRDVHAVRWLVENMNDSEEMEAFIVAISDSFEQKWMLNVQKEVVGLDRSTSRSIFRVQPHPGLPPSPRESSTVYELCSRVQNFFYAYNHDSTLISMDTKERAGGQSLRRMRGMRGCVETAASLVCCARVELGLLGEAENVLSEALSKVGDEERINDPLTIISDPLFAVRWTCLSLVTIWEKVNANMLQDLAKFALRGFARLHTDYGISDTTALMDVAQAIDSYLMKAWVLVVDLNLAFDSVPWSLSRTESKIIAILKDRQESISELERIANEAVGVRDVDCRISFFQEKMGGITHELIQRLPGVSFNRLKSVTPIMISDAFGFPSVGSTPVLPPLIFPGQQIQSLCTLGRRLRDVIEGQNTESHEETLKSLESIREIPISLLRLNNLTKRQLWRLLDLQNGRGLGFTIDLFFLAVRQLSSTSSSSELELTKVFYTGTFEIITSNWEESKKSTSTQRILLDILCDLVIRGRGVLSDFSYPPYIVDMLLDLVGKMVEGHRGLNRHINEVIEELKDENLRNCMNNSLRDKALAAIGLPSDTTPPSSTSRMQSVPPPRAKDSLVSSTPRPPTSISASTSASSSSNDPFYDNEGPQ